MKRVINRERKPADRRNIIKGIIDVFKIAFMDIYTLMSVKEKRREIVREG